MEPRVIRSELQRWLAGQRESEKVIRKERVESLLNLSPDEAWTIYISLTDGRFDNSPDASKPSYLLTAMRQALNRRSQRKPLPP